MLPITRLKPVQIADGDEWCSSASIPTPRRSTSVHSVARSTPIPWSRWSWCCRRRTIRPFNWKVLLENYSENYHTPFVHPELDTSSSEDYPMVSDGVMLYAWDRPLRPSGSRVDEIRSTLVPGEPGWEELASISMDGPVRRRRLPHRVAEPDDEHLPGRLPGDVDATGRRQDDTGRAATVRVDPTSTTTFGSRSSRPTTWCTSQDVDICNRVQRSHNAGVDADGVLATVEERGVYFVHEHLRNRLGV